MTKDDIPRQGDPINIFYYWHGTPTHEKLQALTTGPNIAEDSLDPQEHKITVFLSKNAIKMYQGEFSKNIQLRSIESLFIDIASAYGNAMFNRINSAVKHLEKMKAYSGIKDLMSLAILDLYGGYYFDTTTYLKSPEKLKCLSEPMIVAPRLSIRIQQSMDTYNKVVPLDLWTDPKSKRQIKVPLIDFFALYSPPDSSATVFKDALLEYLDNVERYYPPQKQSFVATCWATVFGSDSGTIKKSNELFSGPERDGIIGDLIFDAMTVAWFIQYCGRDMEKFLASAWDAIPRVEGGYLIESLGTIKLNGGTWRNENQNDTRELNELITKLDTRNDPEEGVSTSSIHNPNTS